MRARGIGFGIAALLAWVPTQVEAADLSAQAAIVSDYRYRGLSLSNRNPAVQFSATIEHDSGLYGYLWGSTIKEPGSEVATEVDFTAGYAGELAGGLSLDMAVTYLPILRIQPPTIMRRRLRPALPGAMGRPSLA